MGRAQEAIKRAQASGQRPPAPTPPDGSLATRLARGRDLRHRTNWPGSDVPIDIAVLTYAQRTEAQAAALTALEARGIDDGRPAPQHSAQAAAEHMVQILARAVRDPSDGRQVFASAVELGTTATEDEISALWEEYSGFRRSVDPELEELSDEAFDEFVETVKKKGETADWRDIASSMPKPLLLSLVARLVNSLSSSWSSTTNSSESPASE